MSNMFFDHGHGGHGGGDQRGQQGDTLFCYFHPRELLVGICAHCLRERLLPLASKSGNARARPYCRALRRRTSSIVSVFALGSSFLHRLDSSRHHHTHDVVVVVHGGGDEDDKIKPDDDASIASLDDSFISIKFEDNGKATWVDTENQKAAKIAEKRTEPGTALRPAAATAVVEHVKRGGATRWRKQVVGRLLLQLARWKRTSTSGKQASSSSAAGHMTDQQRSKGRGGRSWIRSLTRGQGMVVT